jgi:hypothetical protein
VQEVYAKRGAGETNSEVRLKCMLTGNVMSRAQLLEVKYDLARLSYLQGCQFLNLHSKYIPER